MQEDYLNGAPAAPLAAWASLGGVAPAVMQPVGTSAAAPVSPANPPVAAASGPKKNVVFIAWLIVLVLLVLSHTFTFELQE